MLTIDQGDCHGDFILITALEDCVTELEHGSYS